MSESTPLFLRDGSQVEPTQGAVGPWPDGRLHGGAVSGLLAELIDIERPAEQSVAAFRIELFGPTPREPMEVDVNCVRPGRRTSIWDATLRSSGRVNARATAILAESAGVGPDVVRVIAAGNPEDGRTPSARVTTSSPFFSGIEFRVVEGEIGKAGPARLWTRVGHRWLADREPCGVARLVAVADVAYGYALPVAGTDWLTINLDLGVHLLRAPVGPWIYLAAVTDLGAGGFGVGSAELADADGRLGQSCQSVMTSAR